MPRVDRISTRYEFVRKLRSGAFVVLRVSVAGALKAGSKAPVWDADQ